jgi:hypothetical protein
VSFEEKNPTSGYLENTVSSDLWLAINLSSVKVKGNPSCIRVFTKGRDAVRESTFPNAGFVLSTGNATSLVPRSGASNNVNTGTKFNLPGDSIFPNVTTRDACSIEFDFHSSVGGDLNINYVFASEEYPDKVGEDDIDLFGFFLNGENIALVPGTTDSVSINNVNKNKSDIYFNDNDPSNQDNPYPGFQPDGFTTELTAKGRTLPGLPNHLKIVVADGGDANYDSWVLLSSIFFTTPNCTDVTNTELSGDTLEGTVLGGDVIKIREHPACLSRPLDVFCRFKGSTMDEIVQGVLVSSYTAANDTIECVTPYSGLSIGTAVSYGFHDPRTGPFDKFRIDWSEADREFMFFGTPIPQVKVEGWLKSDSMVIAGTFFDIQWDNAALIMDALKSLGSTVNSGDIVIEAEIAVFDDELAFQVVQRVPIPSPGTGKLDPTVQTSSIRDYFDYGYGRLAVVMVRVVASYNRRVGATYKSGILAAFAPGANPVCRPRPSLNCLGMNELPSCPPTVSYVEADLDFSPGELA